MGSVIIQKDGGYVLAGGMNGLMYIAKLSSSQTSTFGVYMYAVVVAIVAVIVIMVIAVAIFLKRKRAPKHKEIP
jgi:heme/copper-type cytochrome/quinol oxidase subunit 2